MSKLRERTTTEERIVGVVNHAVDDIKEFADWRLDDRDTDLLNLAVNVIVHRLVTDEDAEVADIVRESYDGVGSDEPGEETDEVQEVLSWLG